jgi:hypothetical protein
MGVKSIYIEDLREEFVRDFVFPMFRANTVYEGEYLLGTSIARPLIAKRLIEIAKLKRALTPFPTALPAKAMTKFALNWVLTAEAWREGNCTVARVGSDLTRNADGVRKRAQYPDRFCQGWQKIPVLDGCQSAAHLLRRGRAGRSTFWEPKKTCGAGR